MLLITYLFLCVYDCTDSTLTNMNEWIHEELRVMCYIPHQKSEVLILKKKRKKKSTVYFRHISVVPEICSMGWNINHCASLWKEKKFSALSQRLDLISVSINGCVFWLSVCDTAKHRIHLQNNCIRTCWLVIQSLSASHLLYCLNWASWDMKLCIFRKCDADNSVTSFIDYREILSCCSTNSFEQKVIKQNFSFQIFKFFVIFHTFSILG